MSRQIIWNERELTHALRTADLPRAQELAAAAPSGELNAMLSRQPASQQAVLFRLFPKEVALRVFENMSAAAQAQVVDQLADDEVGQVFTEMDPDDRAGLMEELPAVVAQRLLAALSPAERELTSAVLGYPERSVGRRMSPEVISIHLDSTVGTAHERVQSHLNDAETVYTLPIVQDGRRVMGVVSLRDLLAASETTPIRDLVQEVDLAYATEPVEEAARRCAAHKRLALPVVDSEERLVGILTVDDALRVLEDAAAEDQARQGGSERLRIPYLATPIRRIVRSRVIWLLVLAVGATLTVQVLEQFEDTLATMVVLSVFIPLLIGTGGNTGNQAATTVTRALAVGDVRPRDALRIIIREFLTGLSLGLILGTLGFGLITAVYDVSIGLVIGLTLVSICTLAAVAGGIIPLAARALKADPAVFSNPFISTLIDATGLIVYFLIAQAVLGL